MRNFITPSTDYFELGYSSGFLEGFLKGYDKTKEDSQFSLTKSELDFLVSEISKALNSYEYHLLSSKSSMDYFYERCDKDDPKTIMAFKYFKRSKDDYLKGRKKSNKLAAIQNKLKKLRSV